MLIRNCNLTAHTVKLKVNCTCTVVVAVAKTEILDNKCLTVFDVDLICLTDCKTVEEYVASHTHNVAVFLTVLKVICVYLGEHTV